MQLTGKEVHTLKVSQVRKYHALVGQKLNKKSFHPIAQRKIAQTYFSLDKVVQQANEAISALGDRPTENGDALDDYRSAVAGIESASVTITAYRIMGTEFTMKNIPQDHLDLMFMIEGLVD